MKHILILFFAILTIACTSTNAEVKQVAEPIETIESVDDDFPVIIIDTLRLPIAYSEGIDVLVPGMYRGDEPSDYAHMLDEDWCELYRDTLTNKFYLRHTAISIGKFDDQCLMDTTTYVVAGEKTAENVEIFSAPSILLIKGLDCSNESLATPTMKDGMVGAGKTIDFTFNNEKYSLSATGLVKSREQEYINDMGLIMCPEAVFNYKLYLTAKVNGKEIKQLLVTAPTNNNKNIEILFVGDLDGDGKPDFVIDNARDYEDVYLVLFLSSKAKEGEIVRCVGESAFAFDC